jgi:glyoxalase family protein
MSVPALKATEQVLTEVMGMNHAREYIDGDHTVHVYQMQGDGPGAELHVAVEPNIPRARLGAGGVHHVAFRTPNEAEYHAWTARLEEFGIRSSGEIDRFYFRSLYFREPGHILFEIATDGPGFGVDENMETLGEHVVLPPFLETHRQSILAGLKPLD